ncbi:aminotransferase class IV [Croceitalea rosinachiae]|uniref:branched-chain-amino-acid transaminase n=1 Tax=Croceitalea rosinachiae TaxID=3075596 RepID=A0ABU3AFC0_9FLAO|nr:aminotransferase class IV [Croceitalea sp. F388]MDT0607798.1 aminotransferase class IV [Croceitalea sp. F388]
MVNYNGQLHSGSTFFLNQDSRGLQYGDALFETIRVVNGKVFFWEEHYFRLMASMRILRMEIPMEFTMEFLEAEIANTIKANKLQGSGARVKLMICRQAGGLYVPLSNTIDYIIKAAPLENLFYVLSNEAYEVELFKDFYVNADMLSNLKTTNKILNVVAGVYAKENGYQNCILLNSKKQVAETINGNIFLVKGKVIKTPPLEDGCLDGIIRKKLIELIEGSEEYDVLQESISPFELQKADELFITNAISGIISITKYRKKEFISEVSKSLIGKLNARGRLA